MPATPDENRIRTEDLDSAMSDDAILLDVRDRKEIDELGGYAGAINIPLAQLAARLRELPKDKPILTA